MSNHGGMSKVYDDYHGLAQACIEGGGTVVDRARLGELRAALKEIADLRFTVEDQRETIWQLEEQVSSLESSLNATRTLLDDCESRE